MKFEVHVFPCPGIQQLLVSLEKLSPKLEGREDDIRFLKDMLQTEEFHSIMRVWKTASSHIYTPEQDMEHIHVHLYLY